MQSPVASGARVVSRPGGEEVGTAGVRSYQDERSASSCHKLGYLWERRDAVSWLDGKMRPNAAVQGIRVS